MARLDYFADKWLPLEATGQRFELFLEKSGYATYIGGPFWISFVGHTTLLSMTL
jgi:hypothetical protein